MILLVSGCAATTTGKVSRNAEIDGIFSTGSIPEEYRYYYFGEEFAPTAIIGIHKDYTMQSRFWTAVNLKGKQLEKWRTYFKKSSGWIDNGSRERLTFKGYDFLDPQGRKIGMAYSIYDWLVISFPGENKVTVYAPQMKIKDNLLLPAQ